MPSSAISWTVAWDGSGQDDSERSDRAWPEGAFDNWPATGVLARHLNLPSTRGGSVASMSAGALQACVSSLIERSDPVRVLLMTVGLNLLGRPADTI